MSQTKSPAIQKIRVELIEMLDVTGLSENSIKELQAGIKSQMEETLYKARSFVSSVQNLSSN